MKSSQQNHIPGLSALAQWAWQLSASSHIEAEFSEAHPELSAELHAYMGDLLTLEMDPQNVLVGMPTGLSVRLASDFVAPKAIELLGVMSAENPEFTSNSIRALAEARSIGEAGKYYDGNDICEMIAVIIGTIAGVVFGALVIAVVGVVVGGTVGLVVLIGTLIVNGFWEFFAAIIGNLVATVAVIAALLVVLGLGPIAATIAALIVVAASIIVAAIAADALVELAGVLFDLMPDWHFSVLEILQYSYAVGVFVRDVVLGAFESLGVAIVGFATEVGDAVGDWFANRSEKRAARRERRTIRRGGIIWESEPWFVFPLSDLVALNSAPPDDGASLLSCLFARGWLFAGLGLSAGLGWTE